MQSPDFIFFLFVALGLAFGGLAIHARQRQAQERLAQARRRPIVAARHLMSRSVRPDRRG